MSKVAPSFPPAKAARYPWATWRDGRIWKLTKGTDFHCEPKSFRQLAYRHLYPATIVMDGDTVYVQHTGAAAVA